MDKKILKHSEEVISELMKKEGMSRRDALKLMGLGAGATMLGRAPAMAATDAQAAGSDKKAKIVIVGGGAGGIMAAARLRRAASNAEITVIAPNDIHLYQPGQVFMAAGLYTEEDIKKPNADLMPDGVKWVKDEVKAFDPDNNLVETAQNGKINYDFLVVGTGLQYDYERIEGMSADLVGQKGISSVYLNNPKAGTAKGGVATWEWFKQLRAAAEKASPDNPITAIYTQPDTPIKCGGAPQKILYLSDDFLRGNGPVGGADVHNNVKSYFCKKGTKLFGLPGYNKTLVEEVTPMYGNITDKWNHVLRKIDADKKVATFEHTYQIKGKWDPDLEEYEMTTKTEMVEMPYDFIHVVPPMKAVDAVANSPLGWQKGTAKGWLACDRYTLQHMKYKNVFGIGDILGIPKGKTGGSARHHGPILQDNLIAVMEGKEPTAKFDGYTVCPLKTQYGKIMLAEFNYDGPAPSFPLDPTVPRWIWWAFDLYMLKPMYWQLMMRGLM
ncbi:NAD(P)/FAD-dependent oxidoreductase [Hydrogenimonas urashimensis]|uniref:NAD(P)/FAD-dependent oxidoreductase n=1 Tax=Hydrogenimonas urashimensis TaxID=2740515 RepID=UPI001916BFF0|nr:FAD/NAD(P)-binding oxidoreductase [Hydrogenimonas urashimensis]